MRIAVKTKVMVTHIVCLYRVIPKNVVISTRDVFATQGEEECFTGAGGQRRWLGDANHVATCFPSVGNFMTGTCMQNEL